MTDAVQTNGIRLTVDDTGGDDPAVLLLHGFPDTGRMWRHQVPALRDAGFRVIAPDQRGYGGSDKPSEVGAYALPNLVGDALGVLDHLGVERTIVVGHDWGAAVAWVLAALAPDRVERLIALSVGHPTAFATAGYEQREKSWYMLLFQFEGIAETYLSANDWEHFRAWGRHPDADAVIADLERDGSLTPGLNWYRANVPPESLLAPPLALPPVQAPTMGVWSSGDFALTETQMTASAEHCAGGFRYERLDGPGHWMTLEAPDAVNRLLLDFVGDGSR